MRQTAARSAKLMPLCMADDGIDPAEPADQPVIHDLKIEVAEGEDAKAIPGPWFWFHRSASGKPPEFGDGDGGGWPPRPRRTPLGARVALAVALAALALLCGCSALQKVSGPVCATVDNAILKEAVAVLGATDPIVQGAYSMVEAYCLTQGQATTLAAGLAEAEATRKAE